MEVDKTSFYPLILDILSDISEAHFVALDLELSGVPSKQFKPGGAVGRPSLQARYLEIKEAAERFQILQIGLTCVQQDVDGGKYILKPYNFDLNPVILERNLDIERVFSFQSGAVEFLLKSGFDIGRPFRHGVPYLSRCEAREARDGHARRQDRTTIADIQVKPTDTESLAFLERVRGQVNRWLATKPEFGHVNIGPTTDDPDDPDGEVVTELSRFEKRLVHQLIRAEYPQLVTVSKRGFIQVALFDQQRENSVAKQRTRELNERIGRQKGFRWIIDALCGRDISSLDLRECAKIPVDGGPILADMDGYRAQFHRAQHKIRGNPRMLVGHNCFLDFVYIYRTFIGPLPDTVEEFKSKVHKLWPNIVDTKYMSTHNCGDINPISSLEQIARQLSEQQQPVLEVDKEHKKYDEVIAYHEAGYDSFLTAQIAVRLSSKLRLENSYVDDDSTAHNRNDGLELKTQPIENDMNRLVLGTLPSDPDISTNHTASAAGDANGFTPSIAGTHWQRHGEPTLTACAPDDPFTYHRGDRKHRHHSSELDKTIDGGMPRLSSNFWRIYGNKLRVFGTEEGVCVLDGSDVEVDEDGDEAGGVDLSLAP